MIHVGVIGHHAKLRRGDDGAVRGGAVAPRNGGAVVACRAVRVAVGERGDQNVARAKRHALGAVLSERRGGEGGIFDGHRRGDGRGRTTLVLHRRRDGVGAFLFVGVTAGDAEAAAAVADDAVACRLTGVIAPVNQGGEVSGRRRRI